MTAFSFVAFLVISPILRRFTEPGTFTGFGKYSVVGQACGEAGAAVVAAGSS
jgi:hypothetical protein